MQVPGDLVRDVALARLMAQDDALHLDVARHRAAEALADRRVVVARHPDPLAILLHDLQDLELLQPDALAGLQVVHAVAERDHGSGIVAVDDLGEPLQGIARVVGRQQLALAREGRALLQVQVGDDQCVLARPVERARHVGAKHLAADR